MTKSIEEFKKLDERRNATSWTDENWVRGRIREHFISQGYRVSREAADFSHGVDLELFSPTKGYLRVEVKAEPGPGKPSAQRENYFLHAIGELVLRMDRSTVQTPWDQPK